MVLAACAWNLPPPSSLVGVYVGQDCFEESTRLPSDNFVQHNIITCTVPSGVGANLSVGVFIGQDEVRMSNLSLFSYDPPRIDFVQPDPVDAKGQEMTLYGANFADANGVRCSFGWSLIFLLRS